MGESDDDPPRNGDASPKMVGALDVHFAAAHDFSQRHLVSRAERIGVVMRHTANLLVAIVVLANHDDGAQLPGRLLFGALGLWAKVHDAKHYQADQTGSAVRGARRPRRSVICDAAAAGGSVVERGEADETVVP